MRSAKQKRVKTLTIKISCLNAAFAGDDTNAEIAAILFDVANRIEKDLFYSNSLFDRNGNYCGSLKTIWMNKEKEE